MKKKKTTESETMYLPVSQRIVLMNMLWAGDIAEHAHASVLASILQVPESEVKKAHRELLDRGAVSYFKVKP